MLKKHCAALYICGNHDAFFAEKKEQHLLKIEIFKLKNYATFNSFKVCLLYFVLIHIQFILHI